MPRTACAGAARRSLEQVIDLDRRMGWVHSRAKATSKANCQFAGSGVGSGQCGAHARRDRANAAREAPMKLTDEGLRLLAASPIARHQGGHAHFWERALSRRQFLSATGLAGGAMVTSSVWMPLLTEASRSSIAPKPIPYRTTIGGQPFFFQF